MRARLAILAVAVLACLACLAGVSQAKTPIKSFSAQPSTTQAGGHPDVLFRIDPENHNETKVNSECNCEDPRDISIALPAGLGADPHATPQCTGLEFAIKACPPSSQVGVIQIRVLFGVIIGTQAVYNLVPREDEPGLLAFYIPEYNVPQYLVIGPRTGSDYGLNAIASSNVHILPPEDLAQVIWGVPADPIHDALRMPLGTVGYGGLFNPKTLCDANNNPSTDDPNTVRQLCGGGATPVASSAPEKPLLQNPTSCGVPLASNLDILAYDDESTHADAPWPATSGCDQLSFNPTLAARPTTSQTDTASGLDVDLKVPQFVSPTVPSPSEIRATTVTLPDGFSINPNAADGKVACADADANFGNERAAQCPESAKVGTVSLQSASLPGPISGAIYLGEPRDGNRYRIFLTADGFGVHVKLAGSAITDPGSGKIVVSFEDLPQAPFQSFELHFFGSERGLLATPTRCGTYPVVSTFTPWDSALPDQSSTQFFVLDSGPGGKPCPNQAQPFTPHVVTGSENHTGGTHTSFSLKLTREDGDQALHTITVSTPPGFAATLRGVPYCSDAALAAAADPDRSGAAEAAAPSCPAASRVGSAQAGAGAGTHPLYVPGSVYLAGPYKGKPLSLAVITPAVSGPYDLGSVVVRIAIEVDPATAKITASSDPLPRILAGIPLRLRSILVNLDRPDFTLNPTNCDPFAVNSTVSGDGGAVAALSSPFQVTNCADLDYGPKLSLQLRGGTNRRGHPAIRAVLTTAPGEANTKSVTVALPKGELLDNSHIGTICTRVQFAADACPAGSIYGRASAETPLLDAPLSGNVYLRAGNHKLPDLVADLRGQIDVELSGRIDTVGGGSLRTTFDGVPDAAVSRFVLELDGGSKGLLINQSSLCGKPKRAKLKMTGQNAVVKTSQAKLQVSCGAGKRSKRGRR